MYIAKSTVFLSLPLLLSSVLSSNAHADSWLNDGFDWSLPEYASKSPNGGMLGYIGESVDDPELSGVQVALLWRDIEPSPGHYDFSQLNDLLESDSAPSVLVRLEVNSKCHAPQWAQDAIPASSTQSFEFWRTEYIDNLRGLINNFASEFSDNSQLVGMQLGIADGEYYNTDAEGNPTSNCPSGTTYNELVNGSGRDGWGEFWFTADEEQLYTQAHVPEQERVHPLTPDNFESSVKNIIDLYANAFGDNAGKLAWMSYDDFGSPVYTDRLQHIFSHAQSREVGNRGGQIESWMRNTDNVYGVNLVTGTNHDDDSCAMTYNERFADSIQGRYWGEENEFYGDLPYIMNSVGPLSNQTYRFYVSSMRALQLRRNYFITHAPAIDYLRSTNDDVNDPYNSGEFLTYLSKTLGRTRSDTPDAFAVLGERVINSNSGLYPEEYRAVSNPQESCLIQANQKGYALVSDFGRWLTLVSRTDADSTMKKSMPSSERYWGQIMSARRLNENNEYENYELYARKSSAMYFDINDQLVQERCAGTCRIQVKTVFKDDNVKQLQAVPTNGTASRVLTTQGDGQIRTATFEINDYSGGGALPDFHVKTMDGTELSALMIRVNFVSDSTAAIPEIPVSIAPQGDITLSTDVTFAWEAVSGAEEYIVSYYTEGTGYVGGSYESTDVLNCSSGICHQSISGFSVGSGIWWVRAKNAAGESLNWSQGLRFEITHEAIQPNIIAPTNGVSTQSSVTFQWKSTGAAQYRVSYHSYEHSGGYSPGTDLNAADLNCASGVCSYSVHGLKSGVSKWWVLSKDTVGESAWSRGGGFTVTAAEPN